jgi:hypothetical protein
MAELANVEHARAEEERQVDIKGLKDSYIISRVELETAF